MSADDTLDLVPIRGAASTSRLCPACGKRSGASTCPDDDTPTIELPDTERADPYIGRVLDNRFRILRRVGQGGMGRVYLATQLNLGQRVAIKVILPDREGAAAAVQRFHREAKATTRLTSPHVVRVYDFGVDPDTGSPYLVMEYLEGRTLAALLRAEGPLRPARATAIAAQVVRALVEAESRSIVHRDIKPDNIFLVQNGEQSDFVKVMDLGVARSVTGTPDGLGSVTQGGNIVGTPAYMSPEQISGQHVDTRSDLYAVGCLLHEMLTGLQPYSKSEEGVARMVAHVTQPPPTLPSHTPHGEVVPDALRDIHDRLLKKHAGERPATAALVLDALLGVESRVGAASGLSSADTLSRVNLVASALPAAETQLRVRSELPAATTAEARSTSPEPRRWRVIAPVALMGVLGVAVWVWTSGAADAAATSTPEPPAVHAAPPDVRPKAPPIAAASATPLATTGSRQMDARDVESEVRTSARLPPESVGPAEAEPVPAAAPLPVASEVREPRPTAPVVRPPTKPRPPSTAPSTPSPPENSKPTENPW